VEEKGSPTVLSVDFVNTRYAFRGRPRDSIATPAELLGWLRSRPDISGPVGPAPDLPDDVDPEEMATFRALRDAIGGLFRAAAQHSVGAPADVAQLNRTARMAPSTPVLVTRDGGYATVEHSGETGLAAALGAIARDAVHLLGGGSYGDLHACHGPGCVLLFVTTDARRAWCSPACGNRARVARHYRRHRGG